MALNEAIAAGADEALMLDRLGYVATCNATNFFMVKDGEVWTSTGEYCLPGITRHKCDPRVPRARRACHQKNFTVDDVYQADEAFVTGTFGGLTPVVEVDGKTIGAKGFTTVERLSAAYAVLIKHELKDGQP